MDRLEMKEMISKIIPKNNGEILETIILELATKYYSEDYVFEDILDGERKIVHNPYEHIAGKIQNERERGCGHFCSVPDRHNITDCEFLCGNEIFGIFQDENTIYVSYSSRYRCEEFIPDQLRLFLKSIPKADFKNCYFLTNRNGDLNEYTYRIKYKETALYIWGDYQDHLPQYFKMSMIENLSNMMMEKGLLFECIQADR